MKRLNLKLIIALFAGVGMLFPLKADSQTQVQLSVTNPDLMDPDPATFIPPGYHFIGYNLDEIVDFNVLHAIGPTIPPYNIRVIVTVPNGVEIQLAGAPGDTGIVSTGDWIYTIDAQKDQAIFYNVNDMPPITLLNYADSIRVPIKIIGPVATGSEIIIRQGYAANSNFTYSSTSQMASNPTTIDITAQDHALPVKFSSFTAKANGCDVDLKWQTSYEENNKFFSVERSVDGKVFAAIGQVASNGNTDPGLVQNYKFRDNSPANGDNYYRIRQEDFNGNSTYTKIERVSVRCENLENHLYPNPTKEVVYVDNIQEGSTIQIFDLNGRMVLKHDGTVGTTEVNIQKLADGAYTLKVVKNQKEVFTGKLVKKQ